MCHYYPNKGELNSIVLDIGGVLHVFDKLAYPLSFTDNIEDAQLIVDALFNNPLWPLTDTGAIDDDTLIMAANEQLPKRLHSLCAKCRNDFHRLHPPISEIVDIAKKAKNKGYNIYLLSDERRTQDGVKPANIRV